MWIYLKKSKKLSIDQGHMHNNMQEYRQILPGKNGGTDGFFVAKLRRE